MFDAVDLAKALDKLCDKFGDSPDISDGEIYETATGALSEIAEVGPDFDDFDNVDEWLAWEENNKNRQCTVTDDERLPMYVTCVNVVLFNDNNCECFGGPQKKLKRV